MRTWIVFVEVVWGGTEGTVARVLMIIAPERFRDEELFETREALLGAGHEVVIASSTKGKCTGSRGGVADADTTLEAADPSAFDAVVFVGGSGSARYFADPRAHAIAKEMYQAGRLVTAICAGPVILANAGLLSGRKATIHAKHRAALDAGGALYVGQGVVVDGTIVTADGPKNAKRFGDRICEGLRSPARNTSP